MWKGKDKGKKKGQNRRRRPSASVLCSDDGEDGVEGAERMDGRCSSEGVRDENILRGKVRYQRQWKLTMWWGIRGKEK